ncbi:MAG: hypothetical protein IH586_07375, partial [Anaerolineaceae bacterium]|nr:hypothetical protein [Anaerolineaceae bacterium]
MPSPLWTCPICGRTFRAANNNHSCGVYLLADHFSSTSLRVREVYETLLAVLEQFGPLTAHPLKTRIVFQAEVQFAAAVTHKNWLEMWLWLRRSASHPCLKRVEMHVFRDYGHVFRLEGEA